MAHLNYCFLLGFFSIAAFSMHEDLTKKAIDDKCIVATQRQFQKAVLAFKNDVSKPFIAHLVEADLSFWEALIFKGYQEKQFTSQDLQWVVGEYSSPKTLTPEEAAELFKLMILMHAKEDVNDHAAVDFSTQVEELLAERTLLEVPSFLTYGASKLAYPSAYNRVDSILIDCIEREQFRAFEQILEAFPGFVTTAHEKALTAREERGDIKTAGLFYHAYEYKTIQYSLIGWCSRRSGKYLLCAQDRQEKYVKALQIIFRELLKQGSVAQKNISSEVFALIQQLFQQKDLSQEIATEAAMQLITSAPQEK